MYNKLLILQMTPLERSLWTNFRISVRWKPSLHFARSQWKLTGPATLTVNAVASAILSWLTGKRRNQT